MAGYIFYFKTEVMHIVYFLTLHYRANSPTTVKMLLKSKKCMALLQVLIMWQNETEGQT